MSNKFILQSGPVPFQSPSWMKGRPRQAKIPQIITKAAAVVWKHLFLELQVSFPALQPRLHLPLQLTELTFAQYFPILSNVKFF